MPDGDEAGDIRKLSTKYRWNLQEWLRRMGVQLGGEQPPLRFDIQPVQIVGDASSIVSPLLPPFAWYGNNLTPAAGDGALLTVQSRARGGTFVNFVRGTTVPNGIWAWKIDNVITPPMAGETTLTAQNMGPEPVTTRVRTGGVNPLVPPVADSMSIVQNRAIAIEDLVYIPPGFEFALGLRLAATNTSFAVAVQDVPAMIPRN